MSDIGLYPGASISPSFQRRSTRQVGVHIQQALCAIALLLGDAVSLVIAGLATLGVVALLRLLGLEYNDYRLGLSTLNAVMPELGGVAAFGFIYAVFAGHYTKRSGRINEACAIVQLSLFALLATSFLEFAFRLNSSRQILVGTWILFPVIAIGFRGLVKRILTSAGIWQIKVLQISCDGEMDLPEQREMEDQLGYRTVGCVATESLPPVRGSGFYKGILAKYGARSIILRLNIGSDASQAFINEVVRDQVNFMLLPDLRGVPVCGYEKLSFFSSDLVVLSYRNNLARPLPRAVKLGFDFVMALFLLVLLAIPMVVIAGLVRLDGGPALFSHRRVGAGGKMFDCLKFRTMHTDAAKILDAFLDANPEARAEWEDRQKLTFDPRVTWIGRFLRATSLDELPQLVNVLRLQMSLVGPRPIVAGEIVRYGDDIAYYFEARPGLTGLWQVSGRSDTSYERRVELDSWYVRNWSIWHDIAILFMTFPVVLGRKGAR